MARGRGSLRRGGRPPVEREANYITVGAFVLLVIALAAWFVIWYTDAQDRRDYERFEIYFQGSVSGLSRGSPVRYLGVDVGRVADIRLDPRAADRVQVIADIDEDAPITDATVASLSLQGVTGLLYIDLERNRGDKAMMPRVPSERYPVIGTVQSNFDLLISSLPEVMTAGAEIATRMSKVFNDANIAAISATLANVREASDDLPRILEQVKTLTADLERTAVEIEGAASAVRDVTEGAGPDFKAAVARVHSVMDNLASTSARLDAFVAENQTNITQFSDQGLADFQQLIRESRLAADEFRDLARTLRQEPSALIYEPQRSGVEISR
ncbi:MAG: MlaD family protein [Gemmatimonadetes bacterium]|nr:MlaD family protein [Gemmatimonadota bacterium]